MTMVFSQRDPAWSNDRLGTGILSIGEAGCLISAVAGMLVDCGIHTDPHRFNRWLVSNHGYVDDDLLLFQAPEGLGMNLVDVVFCPNEPAPVARLTQALADGDSVVILVDYMPGGAVDQHWVRLLSIERANGMIGDPWRLPGAGLIDLSVYLAAGWTPERGIFAAAIYRQAAGRKFPVFRYAGNRQPGRCLLPKSELDHD